MTSPVCCRVLPCVAVCLRSTATNLCFAERNVYTSEVLAVVMQQLMEQNPLPMLLMRTVIQSLTMYPRLGGFVMNILSRLIVKQVGAKLRLNIPVFFFLTHFSNINVRHRVFPAGVEVSQSVGGLCEVLPADQASVVQRAAAAAARSADQRVRTLPGAEGPAPAARPLLHTPPGTRLLSGSLLPRMYKLLYFIIILFFFIQQAHIPASIMVVLEGEKKPEPKPVEPVAEKEVTDEDREFFLTHLC